MRVEGYVIGDNGLPRCPTEVCHAECCQQSDLIKPEGPCRFLRPDLRCEQHVQFGFAGKPHGCALYPTRQKDIDTVNRLALERGSPYRCQLGMVDGPIT